MKKPDKQKQDEKILELVREVEGRKISFHNSEHALDYLRVQIKYLLYDKECLEREIVALRNAKD